MPYLLCKNKDGSEVIFSLGRNAITVSETIKVIPNETGGYSVIAFYPLSFCGQELIGHAKLTHNDTIIAPSGEVYIYRDDEEQVVWHQKITEGILKISDVEKQYKPKTVELLKNKDYQVFWAKGKYASTFFTLAGRLTAFACKRARFEKRVIYKVVGTKLIPTLALGPEKESVVPNTVLIKSAREKIPFLYRFGVSDNPSLSIRENKIKNIFCAPLLSKNGKLVSLFYCDSVKGIKPLSFVSLGHICEKLGVIFEELLEKESVPELKEVDLDGK